jgi:hypothetical protein
MKARPLFNIDIEQSQGLPVHSVNDILPSRLMKLEKAQQE